MNTSQANVTIDNQRSDGETIVISSVTMEKGGFVAIHDQSLLDGNVVGSVVGNSVYLAPGTHKNVTVTLARPINESQTLIAMPHMDTNGNQVYGFVISNGTVDGPYTSNGKAIIDEAMISVGQQGGAGNTTNGTNATGRQFEFHVGSFSIADWSFVVGNNPNPDRTEVIKNVHLKDQTVRINATSLLENKSAGSVVQNGPSVSKSDLRQAEEHVRAAAAGNTSSVRVVLRDISVQNTTFVVQAPGNLSIPTLPNVPPYISGGPGGPGIPNQPTQPPMTKLNANVTFDNQTINGQTVTVDSVTMSQGGFVTIHDASLLHGNVIGSVIGSSQYLGPGTHHNVTVTLDKPLTKSQTLIAMPHMDTNGNQVYDFVTSGGTADIPYIVNNNVVVDPAYVTVQSGGGATTTAGGTTTTTAQPTTTAGGATTTAGGATTTAGGATTTSQTTTNTSGCGCGTPTSTVTTTPAATQAGTTTSTPSTTTTSMGTTSPASTTAQQTTTAQPTTTTSTTQTTNTSGTIQNVTNLGPSFDVQNLQAPTNTTVGQQITVAATVSNPTNQKLTQSVDFRLEGTVVQRQNVTLGPGQQTDVTFNIDTSGISPGTYTHGVYTRNFGELASITFESPSNATTTQTTSTQATTQAGTTTSAATSTSAGTTTAGATATMQQTTSAENTTMAGQTTTQMGTTQAATTSGNATNSSVIDSVFNAIGSLL